jgi:hypothetical protein
MHGALFSILIVAAIFDPAIVARELGEVSTDGHGAADTEGDH